MRANELFELPIENVYLNEKYLDITAAKNKSSIRQVPIHDKIMPLIRTLYERGGKTLATNENGLKTQYKAFTEKALPDLNERYSMNHRLHDTRHTFVTNVLPINKISLLFATFSENCTIEKTSENQRFRGFGY